ncbi:DUF805 domain-containing protein [Bradyrhizobium sp.]|uniref:DUF805 domain-containing protein n=1 Tax=Bradyrhizobium sp. TaxID=376 RepID=UPI0039E6D287
MDWSWYLFRFDGRINRTLLWQALLIVALLVGLLDLTDQAIHVTGGQSKFKFPFDVDFDFGLDEVFKIFDPRAYRAPASTDRATLILKACGASLFLWIFLATATKRLHDRDRSGWWIVPFFVVPRLSFHVWDLLPDTRWFAPFDWAIHALWLWGIVEMFCLRGSPGSNRFGPDPMASFETPAATSPHRPTGWDQQSELEFVPPSASPPGGMHVKRDP